MTVKLASWNVNSLKVRLPQVLEWADKVKPDLLGLQETKVTDENFPVKVIEEAGYTVVYAGQKTYNGVAVLSRETARDVVRSLPGVDDSQQRLLAATYGDVRFVDVYVPNGEKVGSEKFNYKLSWLSALRDYLRGELERHDKVIVVGDFNIAPEDRDVHDPNLWAGSVLCSEPERAAFSEILNLGFEDTFRLFDQDAGSFSWWDYRMAAFRRNLGLRIDLILASRAAAEHCRSSSIDKAPRGWERPSDHTPIVAEFSF